MPYIYYTGIGCKESELHTIEEFLEIIKHARQHYFEMTALGFDMEWKNFLLPEEFDKFTLKDWLDYTGAVYYDQDYD